MMRACATMQARLHARGPVAPGSLCSRLVAGVLSTPHSVLLDVAAPALGRCAEAWNEPHLAERLTFRVGHRLRRSLGRCYPEQGLVRIAPAVLALPAPLQDEVVCHEAAHLVAFERNGWSGGPHGRPWKTLMRAVGHSARVRIALRREQIAVLGGDGAGRRAYEHRCPVCRVSRVASRRRLDWRCFDCRTVGLEGELVVSRVTAAP